MAYKKIKEIFSTKFDKNILIDYNFENDTNYSFQDLENFEVRTNIYNFFKDKIDMELHQLLELYEADFEHGYIGFFESYSQKFGYRKGVKFFHDFESFKTFLKFFDNFSFIADGVRLILSGEVETIAGTEIVEYELKELNERGYSRVASFIKNDLDIEKEIFNDYDIFYIKYSKNVKIKK